MEKSLAQLMLDLKCSHRISNKGFGNKVLFDKQYKKLVVVYVDRIFKDYTVKRILEMGFYPEYAPHIL
jgi:hypothetical protein